MAKSKYEGTPQHRGASNSKRKYSAEKALKWRKMKRDGKLTDEQIAAREGISVGTVYKAFLEF